MGYGLLLVAAGALGPAILFFAIVFLIEERSSGKFSNSARLLGFLVVWLATTLAVLATGPSPAVGSPVASLLVPLLAAGVAVVLAHRWDNGPEGSQRVSYRPKPATRPRPATVPRKARKKGSTTAAKKKADPMDRLKAGVFFALIMGGTAFLIWAANHSFAFAFAKGIGVAIAAFLIGFLIGPGLPGVPGDSWGEGDSIHPHGQWGAETSTPKAGEPADQEMKESTDKADDSDLEPRVVVRRQGGLYSVVDRPSGHVLKMAETQDEAFRWAGEISRAPDTWTDVPPGTGPSLTRVMVAAAVFAVGYYSEGFWRGLFGYGPDAGPALGFWISLAIAAAILAWPWLERRLSSSRPR